MCSFRNTLKTIRQKILKTLTSCCGTCPYKRQCPAHKQKRVSAFVLSLSSINCTKTPQMMSGVKGEDYARLPNGVEPLPSGLRRNYYRHTSKETAVRQIPLRAQVDTLNSKNPSLTKRSEELCPKSSDSVRKRQK